MPTSDEIVVHNTLATFRGRTPRDILFGYYALARESGSNLSFSDWLTHTFYESLRQNRRDAEGADYTTLVPMLAGLMNGIMERMSGFLTTMEQVERKMLSAQNPAADEQVALEG